MTKTNSPMSECEPIEIVIPGNESQASQLRYEFNGVEVSIPDDESETSQQVAKSDHLAAQIGESAQQTAQETRCAAASSNPEDSTVRTPRKSSARKAAANRANALKSTGPKTERGKANSSRNAIKHGLLAREVLIDKGEGREYPKEFEELLLGLHEHYRPVDIVTAVWLEKIARYIWADKRATRCERGELRKNLDIATKKHEMAKAEHLQRLRSGETTANCPSGNPYNCVSCIRHLQELVEEALISIKLHGFLRKNTIEKFASSFGVTHHATTWCRIYNRHIEGSPTYETPEGPHTYRYTTTEATEGLNRMLEVQQRFLERLFEQASEHDQLQLEAAIASMSLPNESAVNLLLRYETANDKRLYRALNELNRLQRQHKSKETGE